MEFKDILINLRTNKGLKQYELANILGISRQAVSKWEVGLCKPDLDNFIKLASLFNVSLDYLAGNKYNNQLINYKKINKLKKLNLLNIIFISIVLFFILYNFASILIII